MIEHGHGDDSGFLGIGLYSAADASRLLKVPLRNIRRWLGGHTYRRGDSLHSVPPLWEPALPRFDDHLELDFRDLIELRFVRSFVATGVGLKAVRNCLDYAREVVGSDRPFSTSRFRTDGRTIFLESLGRAVEPQLLDLKKHQYAFKRVIENSFKDLDVEDGTVTRWRPFHGRRSIVIDPDRSFGQPITSDYGVPTEALADAVEAEGSIDRVARQFDVSPVAVRDAVRFERELMAA
jgi:uncharacterized protein (DUF433 family)